jgi:2-keto-4-pentenoate hydratase/2-oxohepta-3-ene-1,7-dioic acid hydratase in catechol pathway
VKIVSFITPGRATHATGALLAQGTDVLDFTAPAARLPQPAQALGWFDLDGAALQGAVELVHRAAEDLALARELRAAGAILALERAQLLAPVPRPGKVICIGLNYRDHAAESGLPLPERPLCFSKFSSCVVGPGADLVLPPGSEQVDYEAELGFVIGRRASRVQASDALRCVLGYANVNDVSARDFQFADGQWQRGKSCDTFCPFGPHLVTADELGDPHRLRIALRLNGRTLQDSNTDQLIFGIPALVEHLSRFVTLEPGDLVSTGTPPGVGFARKPPIFVGSGDLLEVEIEGLGVLANRAVRRP